MALTTKAIASWLGILVSYCIIAGAALGTYSGTQRSILVMALIGGFIAVNVVGLMLDLHKKSVTAGTPFGARFGYGLVVGALVACVIWFNAP